MVQYQAAVTCSLERIFVTFLLLILAGDTSALGINCRGSGLCPRASWNNKFEASIIQVLRDFVWASPKANSTTYRSGDHIICVSQNQPITISPSFTGPSIDGISAGGSLSLSGSINEGGICLFPQGTSLTLEQIRPLTDAVLDHKCTTCGSVPIHFVDEGSNDPGAGILTFNYVAAPTCDRNCISDISAPSSPSSPSQGSNPSSSDQSAPSSDQSSSVQSSSASAAAQQTQSSQSIDQSGSGGSETSSSSSSSPSSVDSSPSSSPSPSDNGDGSDSQSTTTAASGSSPVISTVTEQVSIVTAVASNSSPNSGVSIVTVPASPAPSTTTAVQGGGGGSSSSSATPSPAPPKSGAVHCIEVGTRLKLMVIGFCVAVLSCPLVLN